MVPPAYFPWLYQSQAQDRYWHHFWVGDVTLCQCLVHREGEGPASTSAPCRRGRSPPTQASISTQDSFISEHGSMWWPKSLRPRQVVTWHSLTGDRKSEMSGLRIWKHKWNGKMLTMRYYPKRQESIPQIFAKTGVPLLWQQQDGCWPQSGRSQRIHPGADICIADPMSTWGSAGHWLPLVTTGCQFGHHSLSSGVKLVWENNQVSVQEWLSSLYLFFHS